MRQACLTGLVVILTALVVVAAPAPAHAANWSGPQLVARDPGVALGPQACAPDGRCVAFDLAGRLLTYPASAPGRAHVASTTVPRPAVLACPTQTQCTAGTGSGTVVTFDPAHPTDPSAPITLPGYRGPVAAIACPSASRCVAINASSDAIAFDPSDPASVTPLSIGGQAPPFGLRTVSCPSLSQCVAMGQSGPHGLAALTFDPATPTGATVTALPGSDLNLSDGTCPTTTRCVAVALASYSSPEVAFTFDPHTTSAAAPRPIGHAVEISGGLSCPAADICVLIDEMSGGATSFDPAGGSSRTTTVDHFVPGSRIGAADDVGLQSLQCVAASSCLAVDSSGYAVSFNPSTPQRTTRTLTDPGSPLMGLSCHSRLLCVVTGHGEEGVFPLQQPGHARFTRVVSGTPTGAQCPSAGVCVVTVGRSEETFSPGPRVRHAGAHRLAGAASDPIELRCPGVRLCVVLYAEGRILSFDPDTARVLHANVFGGDQPAAIACPSVTQCTEIDQFGVQDTFDPLTARRITSAQYVDRPLSHASADAGNRITALACLSTRECVTLDTLGNAVSFDPRHRADGHAVHIDAQTTTLSALACVAGRCTAGDMGGRVLTGRPGAPRWTVTQLPLAGAITSVACPDGRACVVADDIGQLYETTNR